MSEQTTVALRIEQLEAQNAMLVAALRDLLIAAGLAELTLRGRGGCTAAERDAAVKRIREAVPLAKAALANVEAARENAG